MAPRKKTISFDRQMLLFVFSFSLILFGVWSYVWFHLIEPMQLNPLAWWVCLGVFAITYLMQMHRWIFFQRLDESSKIVLVAYFIMGLMTHLFFATLLSDFIWYGLQLMPQFQMTSLQFHSNLSFGILFAGLAANIWGVHTALSGPIVREVDVLVAGWPKSQDGFRIAQISDLHVGPIIRRKYVQGVVDMVMGLKPDMVAVTGDLGDGRVESLKEDLAVLRGIKAPHGVWYVTGNHEYYWNVDEWMAAAREVGFRVLHNEGERINLPEKDIWIGGVPDVSAHRIRPDHISSPEAALKSLGGGASGAAKESDFKLLLAHQPKSCEDGERAGFDLMLNGHTHWGQYFPFTLLVGFFNPYSKGLNRHGRMQIYVNAGTGYWGPPLRLGAPSEITLVRLRASI